jgi:hypothetical protein
MKSYNTAGYLNSVQRCKLVEEAAKLAMAALIQRDQTIGPDDCSKKAVAFAIALYLELNGRTTEE